MILIVFVCTFIKQAQFAYMLNEFVADCGWEQMDEIFPSVVHNKFWNLLKKKTALKQINSYCFRFTYTCNTITVMIIFINIILLHYLLAMHF